MRIQAKLFGVLIIASCLATPSLFGQSAEKGTMTPQSATVQVSRPGRVAIGGISVGAGYSHFSGGYPYYWPWFYDPLFLPFSPYGYYSSFYYPAWTYGFARQPGMGEIKLRTATEGADVFLNEAWAGKAKDLKSMWLDPGAYDLKVQEKGYLPFEMRVYVLSGNTLKVNVKAIPEEGEAKP
jgi:hypothetical protein